MDKLEAQLDVRAVRLECVTPRTIPALSTSASWSVNPITSVSGGITSSRNEIVIAKLVSNSACYG